MWVETAWLLRPSGLLRNSRREMNEAAGQRADVVCAPQEAWESWFRIYRRRVDQNFLQGSAFLFPPLACLADTTRTAHTSLSMIFSWLIRCVDPPARRSRPPDSLPSFCSPQVNNILFGPLAFPLVDTDRPP